MNCVEGLPLSHCMRWWATSIISWSLAFLFSKMHMIAEPTSLAVVKLNWIIYVKYLSTGRKSLHNLLSLLYTQSCSFLHYSFSSSSFSSSSLSPHPFLLSSPSPCLKCVPWVYFLILISLGNSTYFNLLGGLNSEDHGFFPSSLNAIFTENKQYFLMTFLRLLTGKVSDFGWHWCSWLFCLTEEII